MPHEVIEPEIEDAHRMGTAPSRSDKSDPDVASHSSKPCLPLCLPLWLCKENRVAASLLQPVDFIGGVDGTRTRDPRRDRPVF